MTGKPTAFVNLNVVPMDADQVLEDQVVTVQGGRISTLGPTSALELPADARVIDGKGGFLMPGLANMHVHLWIRDPDPGHLVLYLAEGTTTVRSMTGAPENQQWRSQVEQGDLVGPTILSSEKTLIGRLSDEEVEKMSSWPAFIPDSPEDAAVEVRRQAAGWGDFVKVYDGLPEDQYLAAIAAANESEIYVAGHALDEASLETILTSGIDEIAHIDELNFFHWIGSPDEPEFALDYEAIPKTAALMKENDVAIVSNLVADETMYELIFDTDTVLSRPEYRVVRPDLVETWRTEGRQLNKFSGQGTYRRDLEMPFFKALLRGLHDAGVTITIGTDTSTLEGSIASQIHRELELLVDSGLSAYEALAAGTYNAAAIVERMGRDGSFGTVAPGQRADLLLLDANPLEDVSHTRDRVGVMARGVWHSQDELDQMVADFVVTY
jgi:imidazolonepropionase-like amidohydrolase